MNQYQIMSPFNSKRNKVFLVALKDHTNAVLKCFDSADRFACELRAVRALQRQGVAVPQILHYEDRQILYQYIPGKVLAHLLQQPAAPQQQDAFAPQAFARLGRWLAECYTALEQEYGCEMVLGDAHLRNFIFNGDIYGVDFECLRPGRREEDVAELIAFTLTYDPMFTPERYRLAADFLQNTCRIMPLDARLLRAGMQKAAGMIEARRGIRLPENIPERLFALLSGDHRLLEVGCQ